MLLLYSFKRYEAPRDQLPNFCPKPNSHPWQQWTQQSAAQALGVLAKPGDDDVIQALMYFVDRGRDRQARNFAAIALGKIGGERAREFLYRKLRSQSTKDIERPWYSIALAVRDFELRVRDPRYDGDVTVGDAIQRAMSRSRNARHAAGHAIALGLMQHRGAGHALLQRLMKIRRRQEPAGHFMVALGLMRYEHARAPLVKLVSASTRKQLLLTEGTIALGLLGDRDLASHLTGRLQRPGSKSYEPAAIAQALGFIGDRRSLVPLTELLHNKNRQDLSRDFAAVALGLIGDPRDLPWGCSLSFGINYRANVATLIDESGGGVLDIL